MSEHVDRERHAGRRALVTGAASGIGRALAVRLAAEGASVVGCDVDEQRLTEAAGEIAMAGGIITAQCCDVTDEDDVRRLVATATAGGRIDIVANVAGIMDHFLPVVEVDDATWERVMAVNATAQMRLCRQVVPLMIDGGGGVIVNVASVAGLGVGAAGVAYAASKHACVGLTKSIAFHYGPQGIHANVVCPGQVMTNIGSTAAPRSELAMQRAMTTIARNPGSAQPDQVAALISWLASDEADNVNGAVVTCDGGWTAG